MEAAVVCTGPAEVTYEVCRLLRRELRVTEVIALVRRVDPDRSYRELGVETVLRYEACAAQLASRVARGTRVAGDVGLGTGEIMETEILPNSGLIGKPLKGLHPRRWLVAAVYREEALVVPHGDTTLEAGDRVLLVGDPAILPFVARFLSTGHSEFPLHYGTSVVVPSDRNTTSLLPELLELMRSTRAETLEFITCTAERPLVEHLMGAAEEAGIRAGFSCTGGTPGEALTRAVEHKDVGILVLPPEPISVFKRLGIGRTNLMRRILPVESPVLVPRGTFPYRRILYPILDEELDVETAVLAIDAARMLGAELTVGVALVPEFVSGEGFAERLREVQAEVRDLASSYGVRAQIMELQGNPVRAILAAAARFQLLILGFDRRVRPSLLRTNIEPNLVHRAPCSVLVLPH